MVMDNLGAHRPKRIRELIEERGCELLYLPSYSPDYNPIEEALAKIKNLLRKAAARSKEALVDAIGAALSAISCRRRPGLLRACRIPSYGSATVKHAVKTPQAVEKRALLEYVAGCGGCGKTISTEVRCRSASEVGLGGVAPSGCHASVYHLHPSVI